MIKKQGTLTVGKAFKQFQAYKISVNQNTVCNYGVTYSIFLKDTGISEDSPVTIFTEDLILNWISSMKEKDLRLSSINHYITDMRVFLYWCMKQTYIKRFNISLIKGQEAVPKYYTDEEIDILVQKPSKSELFTQYRTWVAICFVLATGARASTLINIKISDIDFANNEITYRHLKNRQSAIIPLSKSLSKVLHDYLNDWNREKEDGWLFCDSSEHKSTVSALYQALDNYCNRRGIKSKGMHALRHSFARGYVINGGNAFKLQKILTHSTLDMTKRYVRLFSEDLKVNYEQFSILDNSFLVSRKASVSRRQ